MDEREKRWRQKNQDKGRKQIACWLDADIYEALQSLIKDKELRGMAEAIGLLVGSRERIEDKPQAANIPTDRNPPIRFKKSTEPSWTYDALNADTGERFANIRRKPQGWEGISAKPTALFSALSPTTGRTREDVADRIWALYFRD
jgi:hypothetical protein